jgi:hypothetical protein
MLAYLRTLFHMTAADRGRKHPQLHKQDEISRRTSYCNLMRHTRFKIDDITFQLILAQYLPTS